MKRESFVFYRGFAEALKELDAETKSEFMDALCGYALDGELPECSGAVMAMFKLIKPQIDANNQRYENGKKGGRTKTKTEPNNENEEPNQNQTITKTEPKSENAKPNVNVNVNDNDNVNENVNVNVSSTDNSPKRARAIIDKYDFSAEMKSVIEEWLKYKAEKRQSYKPTGLNNLVAEISNNVKRYGESAVSDVMRKSMAAGYQGITWNWLKEGRFNDNTRKGAKGREVTRTDSPTDFNFEGWGDFGT